MTPPPAKISDPPAAIKKRKGVDFLCIYALARSSTSIAKTSTPLIKFDKYSPGSSNNNNNSHDNVYGAVVMAKVIARVHPVHLMNVD